MWRRERGFILSGSIYDTVEGRKSTVCLAKLRERRGDHPIERRGLEPREVERVAAYISAPWSQQM
jgi:hypothetical protein